MKGEENLKVVVILASLEKQSINRLLVERSKQIASDLFDITIVEVRQVPFFNIDLFTDTFPEPVQLIRNKVANSNGLIFCSSQILGKVSPVLKNIYDWLSYSPNSQNPPPIKEMPVGLLSSGEGDGIGIMKHLLQMSQFCRVKVMAKPTIHLKEGTVSTEKDQQLKNYLKYFKEWMKKKKNDMSK